MIKVCNINPGALLKVKCGATALVKGEIATFSSGTAIPGTAAIATQIILGVVAEDCAGGATATIYPIDGVNLEVDIYQGGSKDTFTDADLGVLYDMKVTSNDWELDANDTTDAFCMLVGYDNTAMKAMVRIPNTLLYC